MMMHHSYDCLPDLAPFIRNYSRKEYSCPDSSVRRGTRQLIVESVSQSFRLSPPRRRVGGPLKMQSYQRARRTGEALT
jgi:hypothetical protein